MDVHVPTQPKSDAESIRRHITNGLDAVVLSTTEEPGGFLFRIAGNDRDVAICIDRASKIGGVID